MRPDRLRRLVWNIRQLRTHTHVVTKQNDEMPADAQESLRIAGAALHDAQTTLEGHLKSKVH